MNAHFDEELLSALLDGELSPAEADAVRQQIAQSETLAAELATLERLSKAVQRVPPATAPASLRANVLDAMDVGHGSVPAMSTPSPAPQSKRAWTGVAAGLVAAIALCVVVVVSNRDGETVSPGHITTYQPSRGIGSVGSDAGVAVNEEVDAAGAMADFAQPASAVTRNVPAAPEGSAFREPENIVDTGMIQIQRDVELVRVHVEPDDLHQRLTSARLSPRESSDAPEGYRAFVVEGSRSEINRVLKQFQEITGDKSVEIDRTNVPKPIVAEFRMEAQQTALIALAHRNPEMESRGALKMKQGTPAPAGGAFGGGSATRASPGRQVRNRGSVPGKVESVQVRRVAPAKPTSVPQSKDGTIIANQATAPVIATKVLFFYKLPSESAESKEPCAGV